MNKNPLGACLLYVDLGLFDLGITIGELDSTLASTPHLESFSLVSTYEPHPPLASSPMLPSIVSLIELIWKPLPNSL